MIEVVAVDRPHIVEAEFLEEGAAGGHPAGIFLRLARHVLEGTRQMVGDFLAELADTLIGPARHQARQIGAHAADRRGDRHVVVVKDDDQAARRLGGVVHGLIGHAGAHRAVADHRYDVVVVATHVAGHGEAQGRRYRRGGMGGAERIVGAFRALGEARQATALAQGADAIAPAGQDLMRIGLVTDIPNHDVSGCVEHVVQGDGQLDHPEPGAQVTACLGHRVDRLRAEFVGQLTQFRQVQTAGVGRCVDGVQQRCG